MKENLRIKIKKKKNIMKQKKNLAINCNINPWWFWGCDKKSYYGSFRFKTLSEVIMEEDSRKNRDIWEAIETGRL